MTKQKKPNPIASLCSITYRTIDYAINTIMVLSYDCEDDGFCVHKDEYSRLISDLKEGGTVITTEIIGRFSQYECGQLINLFELTPKPYIFSIYEREQHYGGAEEGGWYYHTDRYIGNQQDDDVEIGFNRYGEGYYVAHEVFAGQYEKLEREYYS